MIDPRSSTLLAVALVLGACSAAPSATTSGSESESSAEDEAGSETTGDGDLDCSPELEALRAEIFTPSCALASCHSSADAAAGLDLEAEDLEAELVGAPSGTCDEWIRVVPGIPDESLLYLKIAGPAPCGSLMPGPSGLPPEQAACVRSWIEGLDGPSCETCGGDACVDLEASVEHCGECGHGCPAGVPCIAGACTCSGAQQLCGEVCVDLQSDPEHCGDCSTGCEPSQVCASGACAVGCGDLAECDGACVDLQTNAEHCGECDNPCGQGIACVGGSCGCPGDGVSFSAQVEPLLVGGCTGAGCHGFPAPAAGLDLRAGFAYADLVGVPSSQCDDRLLVAPGQPGASYLIDKLLGVDMCFGTKMPKAAPAFSAEQIAMISEWICRGALDD
ncbi:MAG: hypothetical protein R6X02_07600 [Enhygromyxa sp.]